MYVFEHNTVNGKHFPRPIRLSQKNHFYIEIRTLVMGCIS